MCGLFVEIKNKNFRNTQKSFANSSQLLSHRGDDIKTFYYDENIRINFFRLKIRDLSSKGRQPMFDRSERYLIVFNGEIYNTSSLIKYLPSSARLKGNSDTEILINLYSKYKSKVLDMVEGMFSFVIYDKVEQNFFIARDRFGIKPLYFYSSKMSLVVSSEIKPIINYTGQRDYNLSAFGDLFFKGYMDHNESTFFKKINSLEPAHYMFVQKGVIKKKKYWDLKIPEFKKQAKKEKKLSELLLKSIDQHLISDCKIGLFLSGGADSSSLASICKNKFAYKLDTYTYDFYNNKFSESAKSKVFADKLNLKNTLYNVTPNEIEKEMSFLCHTLESPFTSIRLFGINALYKRAKQDGLKVILEGHGGDEMNAGYGYNYYSYLSDKYDEKKLKKILSYEDFKKCNFIKNNQGQCTSDGIKFTNFDLFNQDFVNYYKKIKLEKTSNSLNFLKNAQLKDIKYIKLPRLLKYTDRLSMIHGVESRVPYLNHKLFNFCFHLSNEDKFRGLKTRYLYKKTVENINRLRHFKNKKQDIVDPQSVWLKKNLKEYIYDNLNSSILRNSEIFNHKKVINFYDDFTKKNTNSSFLIFLILTSVNFLKVFNKIRLNV
jgi:asparagine synthase (glutamine-hydrolysing)